MAEELENPAKEVTITELMAADPETWTEEDKLRQIAYLRELRARWLSASEAKKAKRAAKNQPKTIDEVLDSSVD